MRSAPNVGGRLAVLSAAGTRRTISIDRVSDMKVRFLAAGLMLLAAAPAAAQADGQQPIDGAVIEEREQRPFDLMLERRQELGLSPDQVTRLQAIAARLEETNRPLREELL